MPDSVCASQTILTQTQKVVWVPTAKQVVPLFLKIYLDVAYLLLLKTDAVEVPTALSAPLRFS